MLFVTVWGNHEILGHTIAVKKALEREQKELIAAGGTVRGRGGTGRSAINYSNNKLACTH